MTESSALPDEPAPAPLLSADDVARVVDRVAHQLIEKAGPDLAKTVEMVNEGLTDDVMQELNARVDIDKSTPGDVAGQYLKESGLTAG